MAATGKRVRGSAVIIDHTRVGTLDQFIAKDRPPATARRLIKTTWECLNCGNGLVSTRGISRCPLCGSSEVVKLTEREPQYQAHVKFKETLPDDDSREE